MNVVMPQLGETVMEGTIAAWHVKIGDRVEFDDLLLDIETDKVSTEIPAPAAGTVTEILVAAGQSVQVGTVLAVIHPDASATEGEISLPDAYPDPPSSLIQGPAMGVGIVHQPSHNLPPLSPAVRHLLAQQGLDPSTVTGTGAGGRIKRSDVLEYLQQQPVASAGAAEVTGSDAGEPPAPDPGFVPFSRLRRVTAQQAAWSRHLNPHGLQAIEVDFTGVAKIRKKHGESWQEKTGSPLTYLPFIARAVCLAMGDFPCINAGMEDGGLRLHPHVDLAIAMDLEQEGLVTPVIRNAETLTVARLANRVHALEVALRAGSLGDDDMSGGTYTISDSGTFGTLITAPIINGSQAASLSTDAVSKRPVVVSGPDGDSLAIRYIGILTQSFDQRAIDSAYSAAFLRRVKAIIEEADWLRKLV